MHRVSLVKSGRGSACLGVASIADIGPLARTVVSCSYIQTNWFICTHSGLPVGIFDAIGTIVLNTRIVVTRCDPNAWNGNA